MHGVSGTPPEEMLDIDRVQQVAGDEFGRVFRRADRDGAAICTNVKRPIISGWRSSITSTALKRSRMPFV